MLIKRELFWKPFVSCIALANYQVHRVTSTINAFNEMNKCHFAGEATQRKRYISVIRFQESFGNQSNGHTAECN